MAGFDWWRWEPEEQANARAAQDFTDWATSRMRQADATAWQQGAQGMLDTLGQRLGEAGQAAQQFVQDSAQKLAQVRPPDPTSLPLLNEIGTRIGQAGDAWNAIGERSGRTELYRQGKEAVQRADPRALGWSPEVVGLGVQTGIKTAGDLAEGVTQAADVGLQSIGLGREQAGVPNPLATGQVGPVNLPLLTSIGQALGVQPEARIGAADLAMLGANRLQNVSLAGQFLEHPAEIGAGLAAVAGGGALLGVAGRAAGKLAPVRKAGQALETAYEAGQALSGRPPTAGVVSEPGGRFNTVGLASSALQGAGAGGYAASQQEGATPEDIAKGALLGAGQRLALRALNDKFGPGQLARGLGQAAVERAGGAAESGLPPGAQPITASAAAEVKRLRLDKFPEEIHDDLVKAAQGVDWAREQRRGVLSDEAVAGLAQDVGRSVEQWIRLGKDGKAYNPEETRALRDLLATQAGKVADLSAQIGQAQAGGVTPDLLIARRAAESDRLLALTKVAEGARAEAGRSLRAYQAQVKLLEADPQQAIQRIYQKVGGRDNAQLMADEFTKLAADGADPIQLARFWARVEKPPPGVADWFTLLRYNSMLSGPRSAEINIAGNVAEVPWRLARDMAASTMRGRPEEIGPELSGLWVGAQRGARAFVETLAHGQSLDAASAGEIPNALSARLSNPLAKGAATALELPLRVMQASDDFARATAYGMTLGRFAGVQASKEGLRGDAWAKRVAEVLAEPSGALMQRAQDAAKRMTYQNEMGDLGQALAAGRQRAPIVANLVLPFLRTVYNITARGIDRSPVGIIGTGIDVARGKYGRDLGAALAGETAGLDKGLAPLGERLGDNVIGGLLGLAFGNYAIQGGISASGPESRTDLDALRAQGWQPYSIRIGNTWVSYANWGPVAVALSGAAAMAEAIRYKKPEASSGEVGADMFRRFGQLATEQTYLQGIGAIWKGIQDPERYGGHWLSQFVGSLIPYGAALNTVGQMGDPYNRRPATGDLGQAVEARLPGLRQQVPIATDVLGRPTPNPFSGPAALQPFRVSPERQEPLLQEFARLGVDLPRVGRKIGDTELSPTQYRQYDQLAQQTRAALAEQIIASPLYQRADDAGKTKLLSLAMGKAQSWAAQLVLPDATRTAGREIYAPQLGRDPGRAADAYVRALEARDQIAALHGKKYSGVRADQVDQVEQDRALLDGFQAVAGEQLGLQLWRARIGAQRAMRAQMARINPGYTSQVKTILRRSPDYALFFRGGGSALAEVPEGS